MAVEHGRGGYQRGCRCDVCRAGQRDYVAAQRARRRGLQPVQIVNHPDLANQDHGTDLPAAEVGPVVAAVRRDLDRLGDLTGWEYLAAAAVPMARILDSGENVPTWPAAAKQLASLMDTLHKEATPKYGRLAEIQAMSAHPPRPDAG
jgi:hypothetical protein